jgi:hypothetical protein
VVSVIHIETLAARVIQERRGYIEKVGREDSARKARARPVGDRIMSALGLIRRAAVAACGTLALFAEVACQSALAQSGLPIHDIRVDVAPLRANAGDPTASWVQQELPGQLAKTMAGRMTPKGGTLVVRIDYLTLGPIKHSWSLDNISGVAMIGGVQWPTRATTRYQVSPIDQAMIEQSNHYRVTQLVQALAFWLARVL